MFDVPAVVRAAVGRPGMALAATFCRISGWNLRAPRLAQGDDAESDMIRRLCVIGGFRDGDTKEHLGRVARLAERLAQLAGMDAEDVRRLCRAAPLHDIGKIGIADSVLLKPGPLDERELATMRTHTEIGYRILSGSGTPVMDLAAEIALCHHERWDGSGYPMGLSSTRIPLASRIVAIADVFDALLSPRPYKEEWSAEMVFNYLRSESAKHFDPHLIALFTQHYTEFLRVRNEEAEATECVTELV